MPDVSANERAATGGRIAFLHARLDEDDRYLQSNRRHLWTERPLREVTAKREIITATLQYEAKIDGECGCCHSANEIAAGQCGDINPDEIPILRHLAAVYSDHPDYRQEWKFEGARTRSAHGETP